MLTSVLGLVNQLEGSLRCQSLQMPVVYCDDEKCGDIFWGRATELGACVMSAQEPVQIGLELWGSGECYTETHLLFLVWRVGQKRGT